MADRTPRRKRLKSAASRIRLAANEAKELDSDWVYLAIPLSDAHLVLKAIRSNLCR